MQTNLSCNFIIFGVIKYKHGLAVAGSLLRKEVLYGNRSISFIHNLYHTCKHNFILYKKNNRPTTKDERLFNQLIGGCLVQPSHAPNIINISYNFKYFLLCTVNIFLLHPVNSKNDCEKSSK